LQIEKASRREDPMTVIRSGALALALAASFSVPALAQPASGTTAAPATTTASRSGPSGTLEKAHDKWRSSDLVGATVYNDDGSSIGTIDNLLIGDDGKVSQAILSVGGFLGIGSKLVAVPFDQLKFEHSRGIATAAAPVGGAGGAANGAAGAPGAIGTVPANTAAAPAPAVPATATDHPAAGQPDYYSVVMPGVTKDSLNAMQPFHYNG
jgi:sporulation protein YlmC with PRC-barrel domain